MPKRWLESPRHLTHRPSRGAAGALTDRDLTVHSGKRGTRARHSGGHQRLAGHRSGQACRWLAPGGLGTDQRVGGPGHDELHLCKAGASQPSTHLTGISCVAPWPAHARPRGRVELRTRKGRRAAFAICQVGSPGRLRLQIISWPAWFCSLGQTSSCLSARTVPTDARTQVDPSLGP